MSSKSVRSKKGVIKRRKLRDALAQHQHLSVVDVPQGVTNHLLEEVERRGQRRVEVMHEEEQVVEA